MQQIIKRYFWIALLVASLRVSWGFSLLGPQLPDPGAEPWQVVTIGYNQGYEMSGLDPGGEVWLGDIGGPHNIGEEYRRNVPNLYYSYDASFLTGDFFGAEGIAAVDGAFSLMNSVSDVDKYSLSLSEFPQTAQHYNYRAQALYLTDLKSVTLHLLVEQLGLADPARYSWTLHDRFPGSACPTTASYLVVQRNFDGTSVPSLQNLAYSPYINGALLSYYITEHCSGPPPALAITVPYMTDPAGAEYVPVAANNSQEFEEFDTSLLWHLPTIYGLQLGGYYTGLTRDDVAGLRYLFSTNNANVEPISAASLLFTVSTNLLLQQLLPGNPTNIIGTNIYYYYGNFGSGTLGYGDYGFLMGASLTNSPAQMQVLFPGLLISSSSNYFVLATNWTYTQYFTNSGAGTTYPPPLTLVTVSNGQRYMLEKFVTKFANVFPNHISPNTTIRRQTTTVAPKAGAPYPAPPVTNTTTRIITIAGAPSGDFFVLPLFHTNVCPLDILYTGMTNVTAYTNFLTSTTTNVVTATNTSAYSSTLMDITYFTSYVFVIHPVVCSEVAGAPNKYRGLGGVKFVRAVPAYDYLLNQYVTPITNYYSMTAQNVTNNQWEVKKIVRIITQPDILLAAADTADGPAGINFNNTVQRNIGFNSTQRIPGLRGPGIIDTQSTIIYNRVGSVFENGPFTDVNSYINPNEVNETTQYPLLQWASFDGSTNDPVLYPNTTSLQNLENQLLTQLTVTPSGPLVGYSGSPYNVQFSVTGGALAPPFTWSASGVSGVFGSGLPPGLSVSASGGYIGVLSGTPASPGTYDFALHLTDSLGHSVQWALSITIN